MTTSSKSLDVFEFGKEDELTETDSKRMLSKFSDQLAVRNCASGKTELGAKKTATAVRGGTDSGNIGSNCKAGGSFSNLGTEHHDCISSPNRVMPLKLVSDDKSQGIMSSIPKSGSIHIGGCGSLVEAFPDPSCNGESDSLAPDADETMSGKSSSHIAYDSDASDGPSSDKYYSGFDTDEDIDAIAIYPDYVHYSGVQYLDYVVKFCKSSVEVSSRTSSRNGSSLDLHLEMDDIVKIESQWSAQCETGIIKIHFISKDATGNGNNHSTSGIQEFLFSFFDSSWHQKEEAIESLNVRYKALWDLLLDTGMEKGSAWHKEKARMPPRSYFPDFNKPFDEVVYPKGDPDAVSISKRDVDLLRPDTFVNDTIIDFYIKYLKTKLNEEEKIKFHFFNSFFFRKLADMDKDPSSAKDGKAAFLRVRKWTRKVNFLEKDFIFIPVNYNYHWSLLVICYFGEAANFKDVDDSGNLARVPCVLHMDSIKGSHAGLKDLMQSYLWEEWKERKKEACEDLYSKFKTMEFYSLELPQQTNSYDCGLFLLHYVELFLEYVPSNFNIHKITSSSKFLRADWFQPEEASIKRVQIEQLIDNIIDPHSKDGSSSGGNAAGCFLDDTKNTNDCENGLELLGECSALPRYQEPSVCPEVGQRIEMTLLQASTVTSTECARSPGLVLKELFESGSVSENLKDTSWQDFEQKGCLNGMERLDSVIEENAEAGELFSQTELLEPTIQHQDGIPTGGSGIPFSSGEPVSRPPDLVLTNYLDGRPPRGTDVDDASDIEVIEYAELERSKCVSSAVTENLTLSLGSPPRDMINVAVSCNLVETHEKDSHNMALLTETAELPVERITSEDIKTDVVMNESRSDSEDHHATRKMEIIPSHPEEQHSPKKMEIIPSHSEEQRSPKRRRIALSDSS